MSSPAQVVVLRFVLALSVIVVPAQAAWTQPRIAVNDVEAPAGVTVAAGAVARVTVSDGPANTTDWIGSTRSGPRTRVTSRGSISMGPPARRRRG
jgi:hypothetical protein